MSYHITYLRSFRNWLSPAMPVQIYLKGLQTGVWLCSTAQPWSHTLNYICFQYRVSERHILCYCVDCMTQSSASAGTSTRQAAQLQHLSISLLRLHQYIHHLPEPLIGSFLSSLLPIIELGKRAEMQMDEDVSSWPWIPVLNQVVHHFAVCRLPLCHTATLDLASPVGFCLGSGEM